MGIMGIMAGMGLTSSQVITTGGSRNQRKEEIKNRVRIKITIRIRIKMLTTLKCWRILCCPSGINTIEGLVTQNRGVVVAPAC